MTPSFWKRSAGKSFACVGSGRAFQAFLSRTTIPHLKERIAFVVDNDPMRRGQVVSVDDRQLRILSLDELAHQADASEMAFLITCRAREEIERQIAAHPYWKDVPVGWYGELDQAYWIDRAKGVRLPADLRKTKQPVIPNIIHYCWFGGKDIPEEQRRWMDSWKRFCPGWEIRRWDESNYDVHKMAFMDAAYRAGKWAFVSDVARLDVIEQYGGVYLDTDVELLRPFEDLRYQDGFAGYEFHGGELGLVNTGLGFGARPHLPIVQEFLAEYEHREFLDFETRGELMDVVSMACPYLQTAILQRHGLVPNVFQLAEVAGLTIYPVPVLSGGIMHIHWDSPQMYAVHHYAASWWPEE